MVTTFISQLIVDGQVATLGILKDACNDELDPVWLCMPDPERADPNIFASVHGLLHVGGPYSWNCERA